LLLEALQQGLAPRTAHIKLPILIPGEKGITSVEPLKTFYESLPEIGAREGLLDASIFVGMPWTDVHRAGMSVQVVAADERNYPKAQEQARALASAIWEARSQLDFDVPTASMDEAISLAQEADSTVFITDSGDNVTAGAAGDGTLVLERLLAHQVRDALLAGIVDPEAVNTCVEAGAGAELSLAVGGKIDHVYSQPLPIRGKVLRTLKLSDDPSRIAALMQVEGITLVLLNWTMAFTHPDQFQQLDIDPLAYRIVVVKEGYLFPGLRDIAPRTLMALTPGFANQILEELEYTHVRRPIYPLDPDMLWSAAPDLTRGE
jgi:microcystin degradation protein MlrC